VAVISTIFPRISLPNFVQFKEYQGKSGLRRTHVILFKARFSVLTTVNINSINTHTVTSLSDKKTKTFNESMLFSI